MFKFLKKFSVQTVHLTTYILSSLVNVSLLMIWKKKPYSYLMQFRSIKFVKITSVMDRKKSLISLSCSEWQNMYLPLSYLIFQTWNLWFSLKLQERIFPGFPGFFCKPLRNCIPLNSHAQTLVLLARGNAQDGDREKEEQRKIKFP